MRDGRETPGTGSAPVAAWLWTGHLIALTALRQAGPANSIYRKHSLLPSLQTLGEQVSLLWTAPKMHGAEHGRTGI